MANEKVKKRLAQRLMAKRAGAVDWAKLMAALQAADSQTQSLLLDAVRAINAREVGDHVLAALHAAEEAEAMAIADEADKSGKISMSVLAEVL